MLLGRYCEQFEANANSAQTPMKATDNELQDEKAAEKGEKAVEQGEKAAEQGEKPAEQGEKPAELDENAGEPGEITLEQELSQIRDEKGKLFTYVEASVQGAVFIRVNDARVDIGGVAEKALREAKASGNPGGRHCIRLLPIYTTCYAKPEDAKTAAMEVARQHFPKGENGKKVTYAIMFRSRMNSGAKRNVFIPAIAEGIDEMAEKEGRKYGVNLEKPDVVLLVEVMKTSCCVGVFKHFYELGKMNLREAACPSKPKDEKENGVDEGQKEKERKGYKEGDGMELDQIQDVAAGEKEANVRSDEGSKKDGTQANDESGNVKTAAEKESRRDNALAPLDVAPPVDKEMDKDPSSGEQGKEKEPKDGDAAEGMELENLQDGEAGENEAKAQADVENGKAPAHEESNKENAAKNDESSKKKELPTSDDTTPVDKEINADPSSNEQGKDIVAKSQSEGTEKESSFAENDVAGRQITPAAGGAESEGIASAGENGTNYDSDGKTVEGGAQQEQNKVAEPCKETETASKVAELQSLEPLTAAEEAKVSKTDSAFEGKSEG